MGKFVGDTNNDYNVNRYVLNKVHTSDLYHEDLDGNNPSKNLNDYVEQKKPSLIEDNNNEINKDLNMQPKFEVNNDLNTKNNFVYEQNDVGKDLDVKNIISKQLESYQDKLNDASSFLEGSPTFVTYYNKNNDLSTEDVGLGGVIEIVGGESPIKYNKILDFPVWNIEELQPDLDFDEEMGLNTSLETTAIILPETIKPLPDDFVIINYLNKERLFKVTDVQISSLDCKCYYKITFELASNNKKWLDSQVVHIYNFDFQNKCLTNQNITDTINFLEQTVKRISEEYIRYFYKDKMNIFVFDKTYDNMLHRFIKENHIFIKDKTIMWNIHVQPELLFTINEDMLYRETIFNKIKYDNPHDFLNSFVLEPIIKTKYINSVFYQFRNNFSKIVYDKNSEIKLYDLNKDNILYNSINKFINGGKDYKEYISFCKEFYVNYNMENYILVPCIIYILKLLISNLKNKE